MKFVVALAFVCLSANLLVSGLPQNPTEQAAESGNSIQLLFLKSLHKLGVGGTKFAILLLQDSLDFHNVKPSNDHNFHL